MVLVTPVLNFQGNCEDAIRLYEKAFETKADFILHYSDAKKEDWDRFPAEEQKNMQHHAEIIVPTSPDCTLLYLNYSRI